MPIRKAADRLVQAALDILVSHPDEVLQHGIRSERAISLARTSQTTFFRNFTKDTFVKAAMRALVEPDAEEPPVPAPRSDVDPDARRLIRRAATADFDGADAEAPRRVLALALGRTDDATIVGLRRSYARSDAMRSAGYQAVMDTWGATVRRPFTVATLATVLTAVREGLQFRRLVDPAAVPDTLYEDVALAIAIATLEMQHLHEHLDDAGAALAMNALNPNVIRAELPDDPRRAVLDAAAAEFTEHSFYLATLDGIATASGVPSDLLRRLFPTKAHIVIEALRPHFDAVAQGVADDVSLGTDHTTTIRRHLLRCARLTVSQRPFMDSMIASVSHDTSGFAEGVVEIKRELPFPSLIEPVIADAQRLGVFTDAQPSGEFAAIVTNTLFIRCFSRRQSTPEDNAAFVADLLLNGLRNNRAPST